jgi:hypothetical protein
MMDDDIQTGGLAKDIEELREKIAKCQRSERCLGIANNPSEGQIPRGLYLESENVDVIVVGVSPGPVGKRKGGEYTLSKSDFQQKLNEIYERLGSERRNLWEEVLKPKQEGEPVWEEEGKIKFDEKALYKKAILKQYHVASEIAFLLTKDVNQYFQKVRQLLETLGDVLGYHPPNILWTNIVKCESECGKESCIQDDSFGACYDRYLKEELNHSEIRDRPIVALAQRGYNFLHGRTELRNRVILGVPHPTGAGANFNRLMNAIRNGKVYVELAGTCGPKKVGDALVETLETLEKEGEAKHLWFHTPEKGEVTVKSGEWVTNFSS